MILSHDFKIMMITFTKGHEIQFQLLTATIFISCPLMQYLHLDRMRLQPGFLQYDYHSYLMAITRSSVSMN